MKIDRFFNVTQLSCSIVFQRFKGIILPNLLSEIQELCFVLWTIKTLQQVYGHNKLEYIISTLSNSCLTIELCRAEETAYNLTAQLC